MKPYRLSKSKIISGLQCAKRLYLEIHQPELREDSAHTESLFAMGHRVGEVAQELVPGGVMIEMANGLGGAIRETRRQLESAPAPPLFEATFSYDNVLVRADLFFQEKEGYRLAEEKGVELFNEGKYKEATEILDKLIHAEPKNQEAKDLLADCFEQLGYQQENPGLRNCFLNGAYELRSGMSQELSASTFSLDLAKAMSTGLFFEAVAIMVDSKKAEGMKFTINLITPENGEKYVIEMSNATLTNIEGYQAKDPDLTLTISRMGLALAMTGKKTIKDQIADGDAKAEGNVDVLTQLASTLVHFSNDFEILPGTKTTAKEMDSEDFEVDFYENLHE